MKSSPLLDFIAQHQMIPPETTLLLGVSGGGDSIYLLHRLYLLQDSLQFSLVALHFNHQLRGEESQQDEDFVRHFVATHCPDVPLLVDTAPVAQLAVAQKCGVEEMARICRYTFFQRVADKTESSRIATAHTADDNSETILMNWVRGAGLRGLSGIPPVRDNIVRPLLTTTREEIDRYLVQHSLPHREDSSNADTRYTRNKLRHQVLPILKEQNPSLLHNITALAPIYREEDDILNDLSTQMLPPVEESSGLLALSAEGLLFLPRPLALRGIQQVAQRLCPHLVLGRGHREDILSLCDGASPSARLNLPHGLTVHREYDRLVFSILPPSPLEELALIPPCHQIAGDYHIAIHRRLYDGCNSPWVFWLSGSFSTLTLRPRREGDRLQRPNRPDKTLKSIMIDEKIPRHLRHLLPVFQAEGQIVAVAGLGVQQSALPQVGEEGWHIIITQQRKDI